MKVFVLLLTVGLGFASPLTAVVATQASDSPVLSATSVGEDQPKQKRFGGTASCQIECSDLNGKKVCRRISASCSLSFETELAAKHYLEAALHGQANAERGRISSSISFNISWRWSF